MVITEEVGIHQWVLTAGHADDLIYTLWKLSADAK
jgi:hypothetical protein